jgi:hypothetical protein
VSKITGTNVTCSQFSSGNAQSLLSLQYTLRNGVIQQVSPGQFFYWVKVTAPAGNNTFTITETITTGNFDSFFVELASGSNVFNSNCASVHPTITQNGSMVTVRFNAPRAGIYIFGIKFNSQSLVGKPAPSPGTTVHYDFTTTGVSGSTSGLDLVLKH